MGITSSFSFLEPERDPRIVEGLSNLGAMRRIDLWRLADKMDVPYPSGATKEEMERILSAVPYMTDAVNAAIKNAQENVTKQEEGAPLVDQIAKQLKRLDKEEGQDEVNDRVLRQSPMHAVRAAAKDRGIEFDKTTKKDELLEKLNVPKEE